MGKKKLSYLIHFIICLASIGIVTILILLELLYPNISEFSDCPIYIKILLILFSLLIFAGTILSFFYRNKECTSKYELTNELFLIIVGFILLFIGLYKDTDVTNVVFIVGASMLILGILPLFSTLIGLLKKDTIKEEKEFDYNLLNDPKIVELKDKPNSLEDEPIKIESKKSSLIVNIITSITICISLGCILYGGIIDLICLFGNALCNKKYKVHFIFIGFGIGLCVALISFLISILIKKIQKNDKGDDTKIIENKSNIKEENNKKFDFINSMIVVLLIIFGVVGDNVIVDKIAYSNEAGHWVPGCSSLALVIGIIYLIVINIIRNIKSRKKK